MGRKVRAGCPQSCGRGTGAFPVVAGLVRLRHVGWQVMGDQGMEKDMSMCQWGHGAGGPALISMGISAKTCLMART